MDMSEINNMGAPAVEFYTDDNDLTFNNLNTLVFAKNGLYLVQDSDVYRTFTLLDVKYSNMMLQDLGDGNDFMLKLPKLDMESYKQIIEMFKYICNKTNDELLVVVYYDIKNKKYISDIISNQIVSGASVKAEYSEYEFSDDYIKYMEIHSHNTMAPNFSAIDDKDESCKSPCIYGVVGKINKHTDVYNASHKFRVWDGMAFGEIQASSVIDLPVYKCGLSKEIIDQLDEILKKSAANKKKNPKIPQSKGYFPTQVYPQPQIIKGSYDEDMQKKFEDEGFVFVDEDEIGIEEYESGQDDITTDLESLGYVIKDGE